MRRMQLCYGNACRLQLLRKQCIGKLGTMYSYCPSKLTTYLPRVQVAKIQREHDAREVELRKAQTHYESVKKSAGPSAECACAVVKRPS